MAWSLESSLVLPICLSLICSTIVAGGSISDTVANAARLEVLAVLCRQDSSRIYQTAALRQGEAGAIGLASSPARVIHLTLLIRDDINHLRRLLPGELRSEP